MDYYSITTSDVEWRAAVCLCGSTLCRGSFLHYATQDDLQQVLNQNCGPLWRYAALLRSCSDLAPTAADHETLARHGIGHAALAENTPNWILKYVAINLRFVEHERRALPCALLRRSEQPNFQTADMDARSVMEQRMQSLVCCFSMIFRVLAQQPPNEGQERDPLPLRCLLPAEAAARVHRLLQSIPQLIRTHIAAAPKHAATRSSDIPDSLLPPKKTKKRKAPPAIVPSPMPTPVLPTAPQDSAPSATARLAAAIEAINQAIGPADSPTPRGVAWLRTACLAVRAVLLQISDLSCPTARLNLLADMLLLLANTSNFSVPQVGTAVVVTTSDLR